MHFMEPGGSSSHSKEPATCHYPEPDHPVHAAHPTSRISILILSSHLRLVIQVVSVLTKTLSSPLLHASYITNNVIIIIIFCMAVSLLIGY
jgi:hypothetical protein